MKTEQPTPIPAKPNGLIVTIFFVLIGLIVFLQLSPSISLLMGLAIGIFAVNPYAKKSKTVTKYLLQGAVIGLGFGMNFTAVVAAGKDGFVFTLLTISAAIGLGFILGKILKVDKIISYLISVGTAICGGSAIAAISQVVDADEKDISISIGTVFILNAVALFIFPPIGNYFGLTQEQFGIWAAIAIHDTSSVVGAASHYGNESLMIATTIKLARALWIIPMAFLTSYIFKKQSSASAFPWFILFFILASLVNTYAEIPIALKSGVLMLSKIGFSVTLFLIGTTISLKNIKAVGPRPLLQGVILWVIILTGSLFVVMHY
ncbi:MAG: putative sulfate exporter family transporter [Bacteroidia bacterium]|nr:putative sulfate exporter family transporter [Bacteroidia bacterium]MBP6657883.1 putative sulfate exporter family transporter [Bacteroidia bacterium]